MEDSGESCDLFRGNNAAEFGVNTLQQLLGFVEPRLSFGHGLVALQLHQLFFDFWREDLDLQGILVRQVTLGILQQRLELVRDVLPHKN